MDGFLMTVPMAQWKAPRSAPKKYLQNCRPELFALPSRESSKVQATGHGRASQQQLEEEEERQQQQEERWKRRKVEADDRRRSSMKRSMAASQSLIKLPNRASSAADAHGETGRFIYRGELCRAQAAAAAAAAARSEDRNRRDRAGQGHGGAGHSSVPGRVFIFILLTIW
ncbi:hypothetical protein E2C01_066005 [Portunus trituberculatus]|uniref:Uncharacterized protein n=1 Tax=Portunus trituberculatus TaxID=210409 RepID=A0A5B7HPU7_PORTR|nr:hypothetical protein [Portunus trituberculatus]